jgi:hypothetical protein
VAVVAPLSPELAERAQPVAMAGERLLPVLPALRPLLPAGALRRGSVVTVAGAGSGAAGAAATSLALSLLARASAEGSWCAAVGLPALGLAAAAELGVVLERFPQVASPGPGHGPGGWAWVVAALLDACDVVLARPVRGLRVADARRLTARVRERAGVLMVVGEGWSEPAEIRLTVASSTWEGVGRGHGRLRARQVEVVAGGRGAAARERRVPLWLPHPEGGVREVVVDEQRRPHARRVVS